LIQYSETVWIQKPRPFPPGKQTQPIIVFVGCGGGEFAAHGYLSLESDGTYYVRNDSIGKMDDPSFHKYIDKLTGANQAVSKEKKTAIHEIDEGLFDRVCESYGSTGSIKKTANEIGISEQKARKILITRGKYTCENHRRIMEMLDEGKTIEQIGEALQISKGQIASYLPYGK